MRIQHNIPAMSAYRNYTNNNSALAKNLEKLSSGYRINRAGDDAAGLAISEKMRAQISGLKQAQSNAKDGISLVQTAEGALTEVHDMLNRMVTLAEQSANGTYDNDVDRLQLQKELDQLRDEINRIADSSNFNGIKLLDGSMDATGGHAVENAMEIEKTLPEVGDTLGVNTVLHNVGNTDSSVSFTVDLHNVNFAGKMGTTLTLEIGGNKFELASTATTTATPAPLTAGQIIAAFTGGNFAMSGGVSSGTTVTMQDAAGNSVEFAVTGDGDSLTFTAAKDATRGDMSVKLSITTADGTEVLEKGKTASDGSTGDYNVSTTDITNIDAASDKRLASTKFTLTSDMIKNGASLRIGTEKYVFKTSEEGFNNPNGGTVIDLSDLDQSSSDFVHNAAVRLTHEAAGNALYTVGTSKDDPAVITLTEIDSANNYDTDTFDNKSKFDLRTQEGVEASLSYTGAVAKAGSLTLQIGDTADSYNQLKVNIGDCHTSAMGTKDGKSIAQISIATQEGASEALDVIKNAINYVSDVRGTLGATQNRLDHTINNLSVMQENIQDAESTIRDTDVAEEMMEFTKNSILVQSAQAMLAQANQLPQGVLQLLQ